jgi:hypothetical protein
MVTQSFHPPPWLIPAGMVLVTVLLVLVSVLASKWLGQQHNDATAKFLARWGMTRISGTDPQFRGSFDGVKFTLRYAYEIDAEGDATLGRYEVFLGERRRSPHYVVVRARAARLSSHYDPRPDLVGIRTGDADFDKHFEVLAVSPGDAIAVLDTELRIALYTAGVSAFDYRWGEMQLADTQMTHIYSKDSLMRTVRLLCARIAA